MIEEDPEEFAAGFYRRVNIIARPSAESITKMRGETLVRASMFETKPFTQRKIDSVENDPKPMLYRPWQEMILTYSWGSGSNDLDTNTEFLGASAGWSCSGGGPYIEWTGDNTGSGPEVATVQLREAFDDNAWSSSVEIKCKAGWYSPAGGSGGATLTIEFNGNREEISISPGSQEECASALMKTITVYDDGTYTVA